MQSLCPFTHSKPGWEPAQQAHHSWPLPSILCAALSAHSQPCRPRAGLAERTLRITGRVSPAPPLMQSHLCLHPTSLSPPQAVVRRLSASGNCRASPSLSSEHTFFCPYLGRCWLQAALQGRAGASPRGAVCAFEGVPHSPLSPQSGTLGHVCLWREHVFVLGWEDFPCWLSMFLGIPPLHCRLLGHSLPTHFSLPSLQKRLGSQRVWGQMGSGAPWSPGGLQKVSVGRVQWCLPGIPATGASRVWRRRGNSDSAWATQ